MPVKKSRSQVCCQRSVLIFSRTGIQTGIYVENLAVFFDFNQLAGDFVDIGLELVRSLRMVKCFSPCNQGILCLPQLILGVAQMFEDDVE